MMVKSGLEFFILKFTEPLQSCCCPVPKNLPSRAELAWQASRYLWRGSVNFKINSRPLFTIIFKAKNVNFKTQDFSTLIEWVLAGVIMNIIILGSRLPQVRKIAPEFYNNLPYLLINYDFITGPAIGPYTREKRNRFPEKLNWDVLQDSDWWKSKVINL